MAISDVDSAAVVHIYGATMLSAADTLGISATNTRTVTTIADGASAGSNAAGASVAVSVVSGDTKAYLDESATIGSAGSISLSATKLDSITTTAKATSGGATDGGGSTEAEKQLGDYNAETSDGSITLAGAVAVTDLTGNTWAYLATDHTVATTGQLSVESLDNSDALAKADGSATGSASIGVGVAVAINLAHVSDEAYLGGTGAIGSRCYGPRGTYASGGGNPPRAYILG